MTAEMNERCMDLLGELLDLPAPKREAALQQMVDEDPEIVVELRARMEAFESAPPGFMAAPAQDSLIPTLRSGQRVDGYVVERLIGKGERSRVYKAREESTQRWVALKLLLPRGTDNFETREHFLRELRAAAAAHHENVVIVYRDGLYRGLPYFTMECLEGQDLSKVIDSGNCGDARWKINILLQLSGAFAAIHDAGALHRDIKPSNVFLTDTGTAKVLDFGIARFGETRLTTTGILPGTPEYVPPEALHGKPPDKRGDIYSFAVLAYELFVGHTPFKGANPAQVFHLINTGTVSTEALRKRGVSPRLSKLIRRCLSRNPEDRPASFHDVNTELQAIAVTSPLSPERRAGLAAALAAAGLLATAGGVGLWTRSPAPPVALAPQKVEAVTSTPAVTTPPGQAREPSRTAAQVSPRESQSLPKSMPPSQERVTEIVSGAEKQDASASFSELSKSAAAPEPSAPMTIVRAAPTTTAAKSEEVGNPILQLPATRLQKTQPVVQQPIELTQKPTPAEPQKPPDPDRAADRAQLTSWLNKIEQAYMEEDVEVIREIWPTMTTDQVKALSASFAVGTVKLVLSPVGDPTFQSSNGVDAATWACTRTITQGVNGGSRPVSRASRVTLNFERRNGRWLLIGLD